MKRCMKMKRIVLLSASLVLSGCVGVIIPKEENSQSKPTLTYARPVVLTSSSSAVVRAIVATPAVSRAISSAEATKERVAVARTQKEMTVSASGSSGFEADTDDNTEGVFVVGVTAQKLLSDNGKTDRAIYLSELLAETARLESQIAFDQALQQILDAHITRSTALEVDRIISHYLGLFNEREDLVQRAVDAGVLSNSDYLELQSLKNEILSEQAQSVFQYNTSASFLKTFLGDNYSLCRDEGLSGAHYQVSNSASMAKAMRNMLRDLVAAQTVADSNLEVSQEMPFAEIVDFHVQRLLNNEPSETDTFGPAGSPSKSQKFGEAT